MKKITETLLASILTFFLAMGLNLFSEHFSVRDGNIKMGPPITVNKQLFFPVEIENYSSKQINSLQFQISKNIKPEQIFSSSPIRITSLKNFISAGNMSRIEMSSFPPHQTTRLLIPVNSVSETNDIRGINYDELKLNLSSTTDLRAQSIFEKYMASSLLNALIVGFSVFLILMRFEGLKDQLEEVQKRMDDLLERHSEKENSWKKLKILALARITDYSKELNFWRDVVRRLLYKSNEKVHAENLINEVTGALQTFGTRKESREYETILAMSRIFSSSNQNTETRNKDGSESDAGASR